MPERARERRIEPRAVETAFPTEPPIHDHGRHEPPDSNQRHVRRIDQEVPKDEVVVHQGDRSPGPRIIPWRPLNQLVLERRVDIDGERFVRTVHRHFARQRPRKRQRV